MSAPFNNKPKEIRLLGKIIINKYFLILLISVIFFLLYLSYYGNSGKNKQNTLEKAAFNSASINYDHVTFNEVITDIFPDGRYWQADIRLYPDENFEWLKIIVDPEIVGTSLSLADIYETKVYGTPLYPSRNVLNAKSAIVYVKNEKEKQIWLDWKSVAMDEIKTNTIKKPPTHKKVLPSFPKNTIWDQM